VKAIPATVRAPELPQGLDWVNVREAPRLAALRGRVVLLYFWTYSNANCFGLGPFLRGLENKFHDGLTVLGFHCPKFTQERSSNNVLKAVNRNYLRHAIANDCDFKAWQLFDVHGWPTVLLIAPDGSLDARYTGERERDAIEARVAELLEAAAATDARVYESQSPAARSEPKLPLRFPARVLATDQTLFVADSGHNRILETTHDGRIVRQFGSGNPGFWDGAAADAGFSSPHGLALVNDALYVADFGNHAIRRIRLRSGEVDTVAGTGLQSHAVVTESDTPTQIGLNSPMDLAISGERLFVSCAGNNQLWLFDLARQRIGACAGTGRLASIDGDAADASFAKPCGLAAHAQFIFVTDADSSAVRSLRLADMQVKTLIGGALYDFGDVDGLPDRAQLQHPCGIAVDQSGTILWVADSFNNKIKALSLRGGGVRTLALSYRFHEPNGIAVAAGSLWIANTNAHEVVRIDTGSGAITHLPIGE
jgi:sugar lactone lactonase YvrE